MVPDAPLQIRHRGSVVACPDLVSGHCCMVEGMTKKYQQLSYNVSPHTHHHSPYPHPCRVAMAGAHTTGVADNRAEIWLGRGDRSVAGVGDIRGERMWADIGGDIVEGCR